MGALDRGFQQALELRAGEAIRWQGPATRRVGRSWVGGRLYLSDERLFFCPGVLSRARHGVLRVALVEIAHAGLVPRRLALSVLAEGGLRPRLVVRTVAGVEHSFSMPGFRRRAGELQALLPTLGGAPR